MCRIDRKKNAGETIVEVMVAMSFASILIVSAIQLVGSSYEVVGETNKRIEAINLAQEGVELVRNQRDTNWLKYSGDKRKNWLKIKNESSQPSFIDSSNDEQFIDFDENGDIIVFSNQSSIKSTYDSFAADRLVGNEDNGAATSADEWAQKREDNFRLCKNENEVLTTNCSGANSETSPYFRAVKIEANCLNSNDCEKSASISSQVFWENQESDGFEKAAINGELYDFYELD